MVKTSDFEMWKAIESAPKPDCLGPFILVAMGKRVDLAFWDDGGGWKSATNHDGEQFEGLEPTHWMTLPEPPSASASALPDDR